MKVSNTFSLILLDHIKNCSVCIYHIICYITSCICYIMYISYIINSHTLLHSLTGRVSDYRIIDARRGRSRIIFDTKALVVGQPHKKCAFLEWHLLSTVTYLQRSHVNKGRSSELLQYCRKRPSLHLGRCEPLKSGNGVNDVQSMYT